MNNNDGHMITDGLLFMKSLRAQSNIEEAAIIDVKKAYSASILCSTAYLDDSVSRSVDREEIGYLMEVLETGKYNVLVVEDIHHITNDAADLKRMMERIEKLGIIIYDLSIMGVRSCRYDEC